MIIIVTSFKELNFGYKEGNYTAYTYYIVYRKHEIRKYNLNINSMTTVI